MVSLLALWLPIVLSAVAVFIVSSVLHMCLPIHKGDYQTLPGEPELLEAMRAQSVQPGNYMFPRPDSMADLANPEMIEKFKQGPVGYTTIIPNGVPSMGKSLGQWFAYSVVVSILVGYVCSIPIAAGTGFLEVFRVASTVAMLGYGVSHVQDSIWKGLSWSITVKFIFDGVTYGLATGVIFGWLWPAS